MPIEDFLQDTTKVMTAVHLFAVVLGLGSATITDILFFKFLKDYHVSRKEADIMQTLSKVIWVALFVLVVSGVILFLQKPEILSTSGKFLTKCVALLVLICNGLFLNFFIQPKLVKLHFKGVNLKKEELFSRRLAFALGAISFSSWYFIFILGSLRGVIISFLPLISVYAVLLVFAVIGSQITLYKLSHKEK